MEDLPKRILEYLKTFTQADTVLLAVVPVDRISVLQEGIPDFRHIPPIPASLVAEPFGSSPDLPRADSKRSSWFTSMWRNGVSWRLKQTVNAASIVDFPGGSRSGWR